MKSALFPCAAGCGLLLGSAAPLPPSPLLPVDPSIFSEDPGCPPEAGGECILLGNDDGEMVLVGLPRPVGGTEAPPVLAQAVPPAAPDQLPEEAAPSPGSALRVVVSLPQQKAYVFRGESLLATSPVSTGKPGHPTPVGTFRILQKKVRHHSNLYSNAPMPFMQRLTNYGIALHAGRLPGYPASHGCIRLPWGFAKKLYEMTDYGTRVTVTRARPRSASEALAIA